MKVSKLTIKNIGKIADVTIELNKPLILFYGEIMQGKTTILNAVKWCFGGAFPSDIIRHGEKEAFVEIGFDGGMIRREWYVAKDETTKSREISFVRAGRPVRSPATEIKKFLNPFLLDQDHLKNMSEIERKAFFAELFAVDTTELDTEAFNCERDARELRSKIKGYGDIDLTPVELVDTTALRQELSKIRSEHESAVDSVNTANASIRAHNSNYDRGEEKLKTIGEEVASIEKRLLELQSEHKKIKAWIDSNPRKEEKKVPSSPDTATLETKIQNAGASNVRHEQYKQNLKRSEEKKADEKKVQELEKRQREIKAEKTAKLKTISDSCKIKDLTFDESGNLTYQGTQAGMLSTSQVMRLSSDLSGLYPEGFGLDLIDRGESLGKSIFEFIDRAKKEEKTILATIVGEKPANVPTECGVFVVEDGKIK